MKLVKHLEYLALGFLVVGITFFSGYLLGKENGADLARIEQEHNIRLAHFEEYRNQSCLAWWFNDSGLRIKEARVFMCKNKKNWPQ
jgi:hypothetical protein